MKTAIKLIFIYFGIQILSAFLMLIPFAIYVLATGGDLSTVQSMSLSPSLFLSIALMGLWLWKLGYISTEKSTWSIVSPSYIGLTLVISFSGIWLLDFLMSYLHLPDLMKETFDLLQAGWVGILGIAVLGPVLEELLFRGAITKALLKQYSPSKAIIISALLFGVVHLNPIQVVGAGLIGLLLAWMYYKTASLIPCIIVHIINNSLSVYLSLKYPDVQHINDLIKNESVSLALTILSLVLFIGAYLLMRRTTIAYPWKKDKTNIETIIIEE